MARADLGFYVTPVGKNSQNTGQRRRIAVAFRCEKFVFFGENTSHLQKIFRKSSYFGRIAKNSQNIFCKLFVFWAKIRRTAKNSQNQRNAKNSQKRRILVALQKIRKNSQVQRRYAVAGENASQIRRKRVANANFKTEFGAFRAHLRRFRTANFSQVHRVFDVGSPVKIRRIAKNSQKFASATALRRRRRKRVANTAKLRRKCED